MDWAKSISTSTFWSQTPSQILELLYLFSACIISPAPPSFLCLLTFSDYPLPILISEFHQYMASEWSKVHYYQHLESICLANISPLVFQEGKPVTWYSLHMNPGKSWLWKPTGIAALETSCFPSPLQYLLSSPPLSPWHLSTLDKLYPLLI